MPLRSYVETKKGPRGLAEVTVLPKVVKVEMDVEEAGRTKHKVYEIPKENAPDNIRDGTFNVALNYEEDRMYDPLPKGGKGIEYLAVYAGIDHDEGQPPTPRNDPGRTYGFTNKKTGQWIERVDPPSRVFTVRWRIVTGEYEGLEVPMWLRYLFAEYEDTGEAMIWAEGGRPWSDWARALQNTITIAGFDPVTDTLPYSAEGGPTLRKLDQILKEANQLVKLICSKSGFANRIEAAPEGLSADAFEGGYDLEELEDMTVSQLKKLAKKEEISGYSSMKKDELIDALA